MMRHSKVFRGPPGSRGRRLERLVTEKRNRRSRQIDSCSALEILELIQREDREALRAARKVRKAMARAVDRIVKSMRDGGRLFYVGAGTSGRLGVLDAAECPPTYGTPRELVQGIIAGGKKALHRSVEGAEDCPGKGAEAIRRRRVTASDVVIGITASGSTPFVIGALEEAHRRHAHTILLAFNPQPKPPCADLLINPVVGPEVVTGSTRMKAGTATKLILNAISTAVMIRLGKVYGNLMVDLQATNEKLRDRALRIVRQLTGLDNRRAAVLLRRSERDTKAAIVMHHRRVSRVRAVELLAAHQGILMKVIGTIE